MLKDLLPWKPASVTRQGGEFLLLVMCRGLMAHLSAITGLRVCRPRARQNSTRRTATSTSCAGLPYSMKPAGAKYRDGWRFGGVSAISRREPRCQGSRVDAPGVHAGRMWLCCTA